MRGGEWVKGSGKEVPAGAEQVGPNSEVRGKASISVQLSREQCPTTPMALAEMKGIPYRKLIGGLVWLSIATQPDLAFTVCVLSCFVDNPGCPHWSATKRVLQYLKGTRTHTLTYDASDSTLGLDIFADADGMSLENRKAVSGYTFILNGAAVSWSSKQQEIVS
jgi:hypothetical protein